ncbi:hypothetical protein AQUSIP_12790 [Aquicella siphonis]|uniref:Phage tail collar domain-containing protein n=1 Tax=Aquicella siphonis TaxID=254247 RepID=A0A5E4PHI0_9COXI|nr:hypothetical protein [Aquicella siphonis]VVC75978.1 hypothetical protein AQUSIP_12790 [Aquicella siphonis]
MDRTLVYQSAVPQDVDILNTNLNSYVGIAKLGAGLLGTNTQINGLACTETGTPSMSVLIGAGEIYQLADIDTTAYGSLPSDATQILKQGINLDSITTTAMTAPGTPGQSVNYLIQFTLSEVDGGAVILPYYNSANPAQTFDGPNNSSQPNYTIRQDQVAYNIKAGTPAATGSQVTPTPDAGYVGGWVVTIANGDTAITNSMISQYPSAPFIKIPPVLLQSNSAIYAVDTSGAANTITAALTPVLAAYTAGMTLYIKIANTNTGATTVNVNSLGSKDVKLVDGTALSGGEIIAGQIAQLDYNGTYFQLVNPANVTFGGITSVNVQLLTASSGTYTPTTGMAYIRVRMVGAGGGSGSITNAGAYAVSQGGSSGNYLEFWMSAAQVGASKSYGCGAGGTAGTAGGDGGSGGDTTFGDWTAKGGRGGAHQNGVAGATKSSYPTANTANTVGTGTVVINQLGSYASVGFCTTTPFGAISIGGNSYLSIYNQDGVGLTGNYYIAATDAAGIDATAPGNGASGAIALNSAANHDGGVGGDGYIIVEEYIAA